MAKLQKLTHFDASINRLTEVPINIGYASNLNVVHLNRNQISWVTGTISKLNKLEELDLSDNQIEKIDKSLGALVSLKKLNLNQNQLLYLNKQLSGMHSLEELYLKNNPRLNDFQQKQVMKFFPNTKIYF